MHIFTELSMSCASFEKANTKYTHSWPSGIFTGFNAIKQWYSNALYALLLNRLPFHAALTEIGFTSILYMAQCKTKTPPYGGGLKVFKVRVN
jgi:hypothetical protein